jgi:hypothetical protein
VILLSSKEDGERPITVILSKPKERAEESPFPLLSRFRLSYVILMNDGNPSQRLEAAEPARITFERSRSVIQIRIVSADENAVLIFVKNVRLLGVIVSALDPLFFFFSHDVGSFRS